ncbi:MAG TPA: YdcF family protein [Croceibacterium sp.]
MIIRFLAALLLLWMLGFLWFAGNLPEPAAVQLKTDVIVVPTGGGGRIERGLAVLRDGSAKKLFVSGVDREVRPREFAAEYKVAAAEMTCCVVLGFAALDTRGNALETANWVKGGGYRSLRLVTSDWHMRRSVGELGEVLPPHVRVIEDAVPTRPSLGTLFLEYNKLLASWLGRL